MLSPHFSATQLSVDHVRDTDEGSEQESFLVSSSFLVVAGDPW